MGKDLQGNELGKGLSQRKDGRYCARKQINGQPIILYDSNLAILKREFDKEIKRVKIAQLEPDIPKSEDNITLNEWFEIWYEYYKKPFIKKTCWRSYRRKYDNYFGKKIGEKKLKDIIQIDIQIAVVDLKNAGRSHKSIKEALGILRMCIDVAVANKHMTENPAIGVNLDAKAKVKKRVLTSEEQDFFLDYIEERNHWYKEMFQYLLISGLRIGECGALQDENINFLSDYVYIDKSLYCEYVDGIKHMELVEPKSLSSVRRVPFFGETKDILRRQLKKRDELKSRLGDRWRTPAEFGNLVFVTSMGSPVTRHIAEERMKDISKQMNLLQIRCAIENGEIPYELEPITPHSLRHTFCTRLFEKNMKPEVIQKIMGHANYATTLEYLHILEDTMSSEVKKIGNFF